MSEETANKGRPPFKPSRQQREDVAVMVMDGAGEEDIARALGIARGTLREHFSEELATGRAKKRLVVLRMLHKTAKAGNVSAQRTLISRSDAATGARPDAASARQKPLGKKEELQNKATNPDPNTSMGELMARRAAGIVPN